MSRIVTIETDYGIFSLGDKVRHVNNTKGVIKYINGMVSCKIDDTIARYEFKDLSLIIEPEFVLPERWHIKMTNENREIVGQWFNRKLDMICYNRSWVVDKYLCNVMHWHNGYINVLNHPTGVMKSYVYNNPNAGSVELTLEQFQKYVLTQ